MSREARFLLAILLGGFVALASTLPLWHAMGEMLGSSLLLFSLPGAVVAFPLGYMGVAGNMHDPSTAVIAVVDGLFYTWLFDWLLGRRRKKA